MTRVLEHDAAETVDARGLLGAVLLLHEAADPEALVAGLGRTLLELIPFDSLDLIGELGGASSMPSAAPHRVVIRATGGGRLLVGVVLGRRRPFSTRELATAALLGPHLGAAIDHARLRAAHRACTAGTAALSTLTMREREVLAMVADGSRDRDIAEVLHIEPRTVEKHVEHIRAKLGARSRAEAAARWARAAG